MKNNRRNFNNTDIKKRKGMSLHIAQIMLQKKMKGLNKFPSETLCAYYM